MFDPRGTQFWTRRRPSLLRYSLRRQGRRMPGLPDAMPEFRPHRLHEPVEDRPSTPPPPPIAPQRPPPAVKPPDRDIARIIGVAVAIMAVVILWAACEVAGLIG